MDQSDPPAPHPEAAHGDSRGRFAEDLARLRWSSGFNQSRFAAHISYSRQAISAAERGFLLPSEGLVEQYVRGADGSPEEVASWQARRAALLSIDRATAAAPVVLTAPVPAPGTLTGGPPVPRRRWYRPARSSTSRTLVLVLALLGLIGGTGLSVLQLRTHEAGAEPPCPGAGCQGANPFGPGSCSADHRSRSEQPLVDERGVTLAKVNLATSASCGTVWAKADTIDGTERTLTVRLLSGEEELAAVGGSNDFLYTTMRIIEPGTCYVAWAAVDVGEGAPVVASTGPVCLG